MSLNTDSPDAKKPCKGILKSSSSFDKHTASVAASSVHRKSAKFDELNVLQTYHPPDKDYGHMKVDEPKTPYNYVEEGDVDQLDAELLAEKLKVAASRSDSVEEEDELQESSEEEEEDLTEDQKKRKQEFQRRRKAHYNEFEAVKLARKLIEEEGEDEDEGADDDDDGLKSQEGKSSSSGSSKTNADLPQKMEVEDHDEVDRKNGGDSSSLQPAVSRGDSLAECSNQLLPFDGVPGRDCDCETGSVHTEASMIRVTRKSVISFIVVISVILTVLSMVLIVLLSDWF